MRNESDISEQDFVVACCTVVTVLAGNLWNSNRTTGERIKRSATAPSAAMDCPTAAKYCGFGRTRFRQLVTEGVFPQPILIEGQKRWLAKDLDESLRRRAREQRGRK